MEHRAGSPTRKAPGVCEHRVEAPWCQAELTKPAVIMESSEEDAMSQPGPAQQRLGAAPAPRAPERYQEVPR